MPARAWRSLSPHTGWMQPLAARAAFAVATAMILAASINAWLYSSAAAGPLIQADAWYFLDVFLSKYLDGSLRVADLFVQREPGDHSQPLNKLILLSHTRYFDLDFRIEGLVGVSIGIAWCATLAWAMARDRLPGQAGHPLAPLAIAMVFLLGLSLNASNIFTWSLVTLSYLPLWLGTLFFLALQRWGEGSRYWVMAPAGFLLGLVLDEVAIVVVVASLVAFGLLSPASWRRTLRTGAVIVVGLALARFVVWYVSLRGWDGGQAHSESLLGVLFTKEALRGLLIPFSDGVIYIEHLQRLFPERATQASVVIALGVLTLHAWFWIVAARAALVVRAGTPVPRGIALAVFLMLVSYALIAGIVNGRVPAFGWGYLHQPRYIMYYQLGLMAIMVMAHARLAPRVATPRSVAGRVETATLAGVMLALTLVQIPVSKASWNLPRYLTPYWQNAALAMQALAEDPANPPQCPDIMSVCESPTETRARLMGLLLQHQLNIFSPAFQMRNRLYPSLESIPGFESADRDAEPAPEPGSGIAIVALAKTCIPPGDRAPVRLRFDAGDASPDLQLWVEAIGQPRMRLQETAPLTGAVELDAELLPGSIVGLVRGRDQHLLARGMFDAPACELTLN